MLQGKLLINNIDVATYGIVPIKGYLLDILSLPQINTIPLVEWYEGNIDVDLIDGITFKNDREIKIPFYCNDFSGGFTSFINYLTQHPSLSLNFPEIGETINARLITQVTNDIWGLSNSQSFELTFLQEDYNKSFVDNKIICNSINDQCSIDSENINNYGMLLSEGSINSILKNGNTHDRIKNATSNISFRAYDAKLNITCTKLNLSTFKTNFESFIAKLIAPNKRTITIKYNNVNFSSYFYFNGVKILDFCIIQSVVWCSFELNIKVLNKL